MRILVVGGGGREHALCWRLARDDHEILCAPGNPGIAQVAEVVPCAAMDLEGLVAIAVHRAVSLVIIGPEAPLCAGLADDLRARGIAVLGPGRDGARIEGSKRFAKELFGRHGIRTAEFFVCTSMAEAEGAIATLGGQVVVKVDGLAAGKGVTVCATAGQALDAAAEALVHGRFGDAGAHVIIERRLRGRELSIMALTDGHRFAILAPAEDHKAVGDGDQGPMTGGMGTVSPAAWATPALIDAIAREILSPTVAALAREGIDYRGILYAGLMIDDAGAPWLLEYNCRFGDPETQVAMMRARGDVGAVLLAAARGELGDQSLSWDTRAAVCVIMAAAGYPGTPVTGSQISGLEDAASDPDVVVFHAGTRTDGGALVTAGGRILGVTALGETSTAAREHAYNAVARIHIEGAHWRTDIGHRHPPIAEETSKP